jgi:hypothetical protein
MCSPTAYLFSLLGPGSPPPGRGTIALDPTFGSFTLLKTGFTLGEPVSLLKVYRLFRLERIFFLVFRVWTRHIDAQHLVYWQS